MAARHSLETSSSYYTMVFSMGRILKSFQYNIPVYDIIIILCCDRFAFSIKFTFTGKSLLPLTIYNASIEVQHTGQVTTRKSSANEEKICRRNCMKRYLCIAAIFFHLNSSCVFIQEKSLDFHVQYVVYLRPKNITNAVIVKEAKPGNISI